MLYIPQQFVTEPEIRIIMALLADSACCRCELPYDEHVDADHFFLDEPGDSVFEDCN
jgi:hypothetical protein